MYKTLLSNWTAATYNHIHKINKTTSQNKDGFLAPALYNSEEISKILLDHLLRDLRFELVFSKALFTTYYLKLPFQFLNVSARHLTQFL